MKKAEPLPYRLLPLEEQLRILNEDRATRRRPPFTMKDLQDFYADEARKCAIVKEQLGVSDREARMIVDYAEMTGFLPGDTKVKRSTSATSATMVESAFIYAAFFQPEDGHTHVKIGMAGHVFERVTTLRNGCPFEFDTVLFCEAGTRVKAYSIETAIHRQLAEFRKAGEWFRFKVDDPAHKAAFHQAARKAFLEAGAPFKWSRAGRKQVIQWASARGAK